MSLFASLASCKKTAPGSIKAGPDKAPDGCQLVQNDPVATKAFNNNGTGSPVPLLPAASSQQPAARSLNKQ